LNSALRLILPLAAVLSACGRDLPLEIVIEDAWTGMELESIEQAIAEWNSAAGSRLSRPGPVLVVTGRTADTFHLHDLEDDQHVIYRISETTPDFLELESVTGEGRGYGTYGDVLISANHGPLLPWYCAEDTYYQERPDGDYEAYLLEYGADRLHADCVAFLRPLVLHELGHFIGLAHFENRPGIMNSGEYVTGIAVLETHLTEADLDEFCLVYDCD